MPMPVYIQDLDGSGASGIPTGATPINNSSGNVANGIASISIPAAPGKTSYITGFDFYSCGATAAAVVNVNVVGTGATLSYPVGVVANPQQNNTPVSVRFSPPLPANAVNTAITVSVAALGAGNTNAVVNIFGFQK